MAPGAESHLRQPQYVLTVGLGSKSYRVDLVHILAGSSAGGLIVIQI